MVLRALSCCVFALLTAPARANPPADPIYVCTDADGQRTYQNSDNGPACRRLDGVVATIPGRGGSSQGGQGAARRAPSTRTLVAAASFPRIDSATQRLRDADRRQILEDELRQEETRLARLRTDFKDGHPVPGRDESAAAPAYLEHVRHLGEDIERSEANIAALRRELSPFRY